MHHWGQIHPMNRLLERQIVEWDCPPNPNGTPWIWWVWRWLILLSELITDKDIDRIYRKLEDCPMRQEGKRRIHGSEKGNAENWPPDDRLHLTGKASRTRHIMRQTLFNRVHSMLSATRTSMACSRDGLHIQRRSIIEYRYAALCRAISLSDLFLFRRPKR